MEAAGFTASEMRIAGITAGETKTAGFTASVMKAEGFAASDMKAEGVTGSAMKAAGFTAGKMKSAGLTAGEMHTAGVTASEMKADDFTASGPGPGRAGQSLEQRVQQLQAQLTASNYKCSDLQAELCCSEGFWRANIQALEMRHVVELSQAEAAGAERLDVLQLSCDAALKTARDEAARDAAAIAQAAASSAELCRHRDDLELQTQQLREQLARSDVERHDLQAELCIAKQAQRADPALDDGALAALRRPAPPPPRSGPQLDWCSAGPVLAPASPGLASPEFPFARGPWLDDAFELPPCGLLGEALPGPGPPRAAGGDGDHLFL